MEELNKKLENLHRIYLHLNAQKEFLKKKWMKARSVSSIDKYSEKTKQYRELAYRCSNLSYTLSLLQRLGKEKADEYDREWIKQEYNGRLNRKKNNRQKYLSLHQYVPWFMQLSFGSDYGTFKCDCCGGTFYHSPSTIKLAGKVRYNCCCGHCTNRIISRDWNSSPYC